MAYCLPIQAWPSHDRGAWASAISRGDVLGMDGLAVDWSTATRRIIIKGYGRWLAWLSEIGQLNCAAPPAARVSPERIVAYVAHLRENNASSTVAARVHQLQEALRVLAPGERNLKLLRGVGSALRALAEPARVKRSHFHAPREMFALGIQIMQRAEFKDTSRSPCNPAVLYRDGLMIALLSSCPIRLRNLLGLKVGQHLLRRGEVYWVVIEEQETKTRRPVEVPLPKALTAAFDRYIERYRPLLLRRSRGSVLEDAQALWISARSSVLSQSAARFRLTTTTRRELGASIGPQRFRDCVAHAIASEEPEHAHIAAVILGHANRATAEHHCVRARTVEAARCYQNFLVDLRRRCLKEERIGDEPSRGRKSRESRQLRTQSAQRLPTRRL